MKGNSCFSGRYVLFSTLLLTSVTLFIQGTCISWNNPVLSVSHVGSLNYKNITEMLILWDPDCILDCFFQWGVGQNFMTAQVPILGWEYRHHNFHRWKLLANSEENSRLNNSLVLFPIFPKGKLLLLLVFLFQGLGFRCFRFGSLLIKLSLCLQSDDKD